MKTKKPLTPKRSRASKRKKPAARHLSELAAQILQCQQNRWLPLSLANWLNKKLNLQATAALMHLPRRSVPEHRLRYAEGFDYYALTEDVFLWLVEAYYYEKRGDPPTQCVVVGLYAHPHDQEDQWVKLSSIYICTPTPPPKSAPSWTPPGKDSRIDQAREELAAFSADAAEQVPAHFASTR